MNKARRAILLGGAMSLASAGGIAARPTVVKLVGPPWPLGELIPKAVGGWRDAEQHGQVVNPPAKAIIDTLYSEVVSRTYVDSTGYPVMLCVAYGNDQRGSLAAHLPETCYRAQGFAVLDKARAVVQTPFGDIPGRRLNTRLGSRNEPVTYWFTFGGAPIRNPWERRWVEFLVGILGQVPDGLLFRVSSIDDEPARAYREQDRFVADLLQAVREPGRARLAGLKPAASS